MSEQTFEIIYQLVGIAGAVVCVISFQCKKNIQIFIFQLLTCLIFLAQMAMKQVWAAVMVNAISAARCLFFAVSKNKKVNFWATIVIALLLATSIPVSIVVFKQNPVVSVLIASATIAGTLSYYVNNGLIIRLIQLFFVSPCWIINDIVFKTIGGLVAESFNIISIIVSIIRYQKVGFDKDGNTKVFVLRNSDNGKRGKVFTVFEAGKKENNIEMVFKCYESNKQSYANKDELYNGDCCGVVFSNSDKDEFFEIMIAPNGSYAISKVIRDGIKITKEKVELDVVNYQVKDTKKGYIVTINIPLEKTNYNKDVVLKYNAYRLETKKDIKTISAVLPKYTGTFYNSTNMFEL